MGPPNLPSPLQHEMQPVWTSGEMRWWPDLFLRGTLCTKWQLHKPVQRLKGLTASNSRKGPRSVHDSFSSNQRACGVKHGHKPAMRRGPKIVIILLDGQQGAQDLIAWFSPL